MQHIFYTRIRFVSNIQQFFKLRIQSCNSLHYNLRVGWCLACMGHMSHLHHYKTNALTYTSKCFRYISFACILYISTVLSGYINKLYKCIFIHWRNWMNVHVTLRMSYIPYNTCNAYHQISSTCIPSRWPSPCRCSHRCIITITGTILLIYDNARHLCLPTKRELSGVYTGTPSQHYINNVNCWG